MAAPPGWTEEDWAENLRQKALFQQSMTHGQPPPDGIPPSLASSPLGGQLATGAPPPAAGPPPLTGLGSDMRPLDPSQTTTAPAPAGDPRPVVTAGENFDPTALAGGGSPRVGTLTNKTTSTKTTDAPQTPEEVAQLKESYGKRADEHWDAAQDRKNALKTDQQRRADQMLVQSLRKKETTASTREYGAQFKEIRERYSKSRQDFLKLKVDPERYIKNMPTLQRITTVIASALGGLAEGLSSGAVKNNTLKMLDAAITRDIGAQKANIAQSLQALKMTGSQEREVWDRLKYWGKQQRLAAYDYAKMYEAAQASQAKGMGEVTAHLQQMRLYDEAKIKVGTLGRPKVVKTEQVKKRQAVMGGTGAKGSKKSLASMGLGGLTDKTTIRQLREKISKAANARDAASRLKQLMKKVNWKTGVLLKGIDPNSWASMVKHQVHLLGFSQREIFGDKGPIRHDDAKTFAVVAPRNVLNYVMKNKWIRRSIQLFLRRANAFELNAIKGARMTIPQILRREGQLKKVAAHDDAKAGAGAGRSKRWQ